MEWRQILGFMGIARLGSFTRAAEEIYRTQPALSQQMKALESELGCELFERIGRKRILLTPAGERFFEFAREVTGAHETLVEDLRDHGGRGGGRLRIAAPFTALYHLFPPVVSRFVEQHPEVELTLLDRPQEEAVRMVREGQADFAVAARSRVPAGVEAIDWRELDTLLLTPASHPLTALERVSLMDVAAYPLILGPRGRGGRGREIVETYYNERGVDYRVVMESGNVELSALYVKAGLGVAFATIARDARARRDPELAFLPLPGVFRSDHVVVVHRKEMRLTGFRRAFLEIVLGSGENSRK